MGQTWKVGDLIAGRWRVEETLCGGMGEVYIVLDLDTRERLAAKTYREDVLGSNPTVAQRFVREALTWIHLAPHPNVVAARFVQAVQGRPLLFLEYVPGGTLKELLPELCPRSRFDPRFRRVQELALEFCAAMNHAARHGVAAHRDIKPENCLLTRGQRPQLKVTDFGLARALEDAEAGPNTASADVASGAASWHPLPGLTVFRTRTGCAAGTPSHMPPEQFLDLKRASVRSDVYSFGVMLYQMLTGRLPFPGPTLQDFFEQHSSADPPLAPSAGEFGQVVARCLEKDPARRFADFSEVAEAVTAAFPNLRTSYDHEPGPDLPACDVPGLDVGRTAPSDPMPEAAAQSGLPLLAGRVSKAFSMEDLEQRPEGEGFPLELEDDPVVLLKHARWKIREGWEYAQTLLRSENWASALDALRSLTDAFPGFGRAWAEKGIVLMKAPGRHADALSCLEEARRLGEQGLDKCIGHCRRTLAADLVEKARSLLQLKQTDQAFDTLRQATVRFPEFGRAWAEMGVLLMAAPSRHAEALACMEEARRLGEQGLDERIARRRSRQA